MSTTTIETRSLGAGGRQLSAVGVGTWALGRSVHLRRPRRRVG